jgi:patatin-related protein
MDVPIGSTAGEDNLWVPRELRLAVTMNGGVSLAVYIGGVAHEFNRLTQDSSRYMPLLQLLGHHQAPAVDVLTGTSAGGINAAALAIAQANDRDTDLSVLKTLWIEHGQIGSLLRPPFRQGPPSLLQGDEYFFPKIKSAFQHLANGFKRKTPQHAVDLTITTTLLTPVTERSQDDLGTKMVQPQHAGLFQFRSPGPPLSEDEQPPSPPENRQKEQEEEKDDFATEQIDDTVIAIGLAARASAGFPVAFEPTFVPVHDSLKDDRPDMAGYANWARKDTHLSRFAIDGGVLANTPTQPALEAIRRHQASNKLIRRVLVLIHPHALQANTFTEESDDDAQPPTLFGSLAGVLRASSSVGSRNYVEEIEKHNELALRWRDGRIITLENFPTAAKLTSFLTENDGAARIQWTLFRSMRERRGAYVLAHQIRRTTSVPFSQLIDEARNVLDRYSLPPDEEGPKRELPFVPDIPPNFDNMPTNEWRWGIDLATGIATLATDLLRQVLNTQLSDLQSMRRAENGASPSDLLREANTAWTKAVNAGIAIDALGTAEEKAAESTAPLEDPNEDEYEHVRHRLADNLRKYAARMGRGGADDGDGSDGGQVDTILREKVAEPLLNVINVIKRLGKPAQIDEPGTLLGSNPLRDAQSADDLLRILLTVEVIAYLLSEEGGADSGVPSTPVEFVQLSAQVEQDFAPNFTSDDKLAGMSLNRFGAFLKRSWRANDWIWGRLDAIKIVMHILLTPETIRRLAQYSKKPEELIDDICARAFPPRDYAVNPSAGDDSDPPYSHLVAPGAALEQLYEDAKNEVTEARAGGQKPMTALVSLAAYGFQISAANEDVPWLAETIQDDQDDGASGSKSAGFLSRYQELRQLSFRWPGDRGYRLLTLFANSKIGQESLSEELPSDLMIRTAATAAATGATMISAERSGLGFAKPATRLVRGVVAAPYWTIVGLTHRGQLARIAAATVLALGISLVALGLLAPLTGFISALVPTLGVGSLITVFAYAALRSRSMVHGAALLGLFVPLVALAIYRLSSEPPDKQSGNTGFQFTVQEGTLATVLLLVLIGGTVFIANFNSPVASPFAHLRRDRGKLETTSKPPSSTNGLAWLSEHKLRWLTLFLLLPVAAFGAAVVGFGDALLWHDDSVGKQIVNWPTLHIGVTAWQIDAIGMALFFTPLIIIFAYGAIAGMTKARELRPHPALAPSSFPLSTTVGQAPQTSDPEASPTATAAQPASGDAADENPAPQSAAAATPPDTDPPPAPTAVTGDSQAPMNGTAAQPRDGAATSGADRARKEHIDMPTRLLRDPAGLAIAWSAFYGALYLLLAVVIVGAHGMTPPPWAIGAAMVSVILGFGFSVVAVLFLPARRERRLVRKLASAFAANRTTPQDGKTVEEGGLDDETIKVFAKIGEESSYLLSIETKTKMLVLSKRGRKVAARALQRSEDLLRNMPATATQTPGTGQ